MVEWAEVMAAVGVAQSGDADEGRQRLLACWAGAAADDHATRCVVAHYLADLQPDLDDEIAWDELALDEHGHLRDDALTPVGIPSARVLLPSLHLNLGDGLARRGDVAAARVHLELGLAHVDGLVDDGYGAMVRAGLAGLEARVAAADACRPPRGGPR